MSQMSRQQIPKHDPKCPGGKMCGRENVRWGRGLWVLPRDASYPLPVPRDPLWEKIQSKLNEMKGGEPKTE